ncbi:MAG: sulfate/thiosulfate ABC transporter permease CysW, partial [Methylotenera sp.]|nr:sulfate/thiosulfate ABC transporter permease CysW [Methylotenera sp.]
MSTSATAANLPTSQYSNYHTKVARSRATSEPAWIRWSLVVITLLFLSLFLFVPLIAVFTEALRKGFDTYITALVDPDA